MADVEKNKQVWERWDWGARGDEWSAWWGGTEAEWHGALLPRIHAFIPAGRVLEIAPGYGRWTQYLKDECEELVLVDLAETCIEHCRQRFADASHISYHVNDGRSLEMVEDGSIDFAFSFDSLVHVEADALDGYVEQLATKLSPEGVGFIHHSNLGSYRKRVALAKRVPKRFLGSLIERGLVVDLPAWRAETMTADHFLETCQRHGLTCISQERISWEHGTHLIDAISVFTRRGSNWDRPLSVVRNASFGREAQRMAALYATPDSS